MSIVLLTDAWVFSMQAVTSTQNLLETMRLQLPDCGDVFRRPSTRSRIEALAAQWAQDASLDADERQEQTQLTDDLLHAL